ncbi:uncharacterized protein LOC134258083 [Saccostrea cucullata]|uniref:uncharacterized protein LOC134258083 n=1 Tax=Saccostrea cuccullata TaxID=36930 RepID=UPI002ED56B79
MACAGEHASASLSKSHKIVAFKDKNSTPVYPESISNAKSRCKMYCKHRNFPVCKKRIASDQHLGHRLSEILDVLEKIKDKVTKDQTELNEVIYPTYQDIASDVQNRMSYLEREYGDSLNSLIKNMERTGHKISEILEVLEERKDKLRKNHIELNEVIFPTYQDIVSDVKNRISQVEKKYGDLFTAITKHGEDWHREIDKLVKKLKAEYDEIKHMQIQAL